MGSSGTGRFSDYTGTGRDSGGGGGNSGSDKCLESLEEQLEEVATSAYFLNHNNVPPEGTPVEVQLVKRLEVRAVGGDVIGYLPTKFNYLAGCINDGYTYSGAVTASAFTKVPAVLVSITGSR